MRKRNRVILAAVLLAAVIFAAVPAGKASGAGEAPDITKECTFRICSSLDR